MKKPVKRKLRQYEKIWITLREEVKKNKDAKIVVSCPKKDRAKIIKAVTKEKWMDEEWPEKYFFRLQTKLVPEGVQFSLGHHRLNQIISTKL